MTAETLFIRSIATPPGLPWAQARAAALDAALGAPANAQQLRIAVRRLAPWRPRATGAFAAAYAHALTAPPHSEAIVEGRLVRFQFKGGPGLRRTRLQGLVGGAILLVGAAAAVISLSMATAVRAHNEQVLAAREDSVRRIERKALAVRRARADQALLAEAHAERSAMSNLALDLAWLGQARRRDVEIREVRWSPAEMVVATKGRGSPIVGAERPVEADGSDASGARWKIGPLPAPVVRDGVARPSVVSSNAPAAETRLR